MRPGFEVGYELNGKYYVNNHLMFKILVHETNGQYTMGKRASDAELQAAANIEVGSSRTAGCVGSLACTLASGVYACMGCACEWCVHVVCSAHCCRCCPSHLRPKQAGGRKLLDAKNKQQPVTQPGQKMFMIVSCPLRQGCCLACAARSS